MFYGWGVQRLGYFRVRVFNGWGLGLGYLHLNWGFRAGVFQGWGVQGLGWGRFNYQGFHGPPTLVGQGACGFDKARCLVVK